MTSVEDELALQLVKENYGELATSLAALLVKKKWYPFMLIAKDLNLDMKMVRANKQHLQRYNQQQEHAY